MSIKEINDQKKWDQFVQLQPIYTFFQSWNWGKYQKKRNRKIWRLATTEKGDIVGGGFFYKIEAKRGTFLVSPHGPFLRWEDKEKSQHFLNHIKKIAKKEKAWFIRMGIPLRDSEKNNRVLGPYFFQKRPAPTSYSAENFWILDITCEKKKLLSDMKKGHRYSVRKAKREGAKIKKITGKDSTEKQNKALKEFYKIYEKTVKREDFTGFSFEYIKNEFKSFAADDEAVIFHVKYNDEIIASAIIIYYGNEGAYHQGASLRKYKKVPASQLLQWNAILEGKKRDCKRYNFWGIAGPEAGEDHPWHGLTYFKQGFGGERLDFVPAQDIKLSWKYNLTRLVEKWQRRQRDL